MSFNIIVPLATFLVGAALKEVFTSSAWSSGNSRSLGRPVHGIYEIGPDINNSFVHPFDSSVSFKSHNFADRIATAD